jgi:arylsulfatase A-like enzyme
MFKRPRAAIQFGLLAAIAGLAIETLKCEGFAASGMPPNIVFILADDLGWADIGCDGSKYYETPHIDRLAKQGMRFTDAYAACPVCSPTRASILTGKWPARLHLTDWIPGEGNAANHRLLVPKWRQYLPLDEMNLARALKAAGYATASIGKWHLGGPEYFPEHQGFDLNVAGTHWGQPASYFWPYEGKTHTVAGLRESGHEGEYLTDRLTLEAGKFIEQNKDRPFFLYLPHYAVHVPLQGKAEVVAKYKAKKPVGEQKNATYAAMVEGVDDSVGHIMAKLDALKIADRTIVVFFSDNGGLWPHSTSNAPLRAGKGYLYEGGIREPMIVKWPGHTQPGSTCSVPVQSVDFFPTLLAMAGVKQSNMVDGESLMPLLEQSGRDGKKMARAALYWHYPHYWNGTAVRPAGAVRAGDWKLIEYYEDMRVELFNLKDDLSEAHDLAATRPAEVSRLRAMLQDWRKSVDAQMPSPNPNYRPADAKSKALAESHEPPPNIWD